MNLDAVDPYRLARETALELRDKGAESKICYYLGCVYVDLCQFDQGAKLSRLCNHGGHQQRWQPQASIVEGYHNTSAARLYRMHQHSGGLHLLFQPWQQAA